MKLYEEILKKSRHIDEKYENLKASEVYNIKINFHVPTFHSRFEKIKSYPFLPLKIEELLKTKTYNLTKNHLFLVDSVLYEQRFVKDFLKENKIKPIVLESIESEVKTKKFMDKVMKENKLKKDENITLVVIGGGLMCNVGTYLAERRSYNLILFPSTVLSMADSSGGKVRVNVLLKHRAYKHFYKSFYEPNAMFLEDRFLDSLPVKQIQIGLVEIIKHGLFQSSKLHDFLFKEGKNLFQDKQKLIKAILWAAELKRVCMDIDVEENENGSRRILRGGHGYSDRIEEDKRFSISHGIAVAIGIVKQLEEEKDTKLLKKAKEIFDLFKIPYLPNTKK